GKVIYLGPPLSLIDTANLPPGFDFPRLTIVGVVKDVRHTGLSQAVAPEVYNPHEQAQGIEISRSMYVAVRTTADPLSIIGAVKSQVAAIDRDQPIANISTMQERLRGSLSQPRFNTLLLGVFASVAMILAAVGIYGVMAYSVTQRTHEIGVRMALGARQSDVLRMVIGQGLVLTVAGIAIGLVAAVLMTRLMESLLFGVSATDPLTFALIALLLGSVAVLASYIPARRAMKVDPMVALRYE
ncbi:MAG TPA: FtsX-like permease family protein, partial [Blastocatellia bacterium]|nr:FtsX-like permease family protein [Blastocatellia bacterium]